MKGDIKLIVEDSMKLNKMDNPKDEMEKASFNNYRIAVYQWVKDKQIKYKKGSLSHREIIKLEKIPHWTWNEDD